MRVNRRFIYWGVFLVALGGVLVAADLGAVDSSTLADALTLWPLALVAIGVGIVLRRTQLALPGGMLAAALPGLVLGGAIAAAPRLAVDCGIPTDTVAVTTTDGTFDGAANVRVTSGCGSLVVTTASGNRWSLDSGNTEGRQPVIRSSPNSLSIETGIRDGWGAFHAGRDTWNLTLPTSPIDDLTMDVNAGTGRIDLPGAQLGRLNVTTNAAETIVDVEDATLSGFDGSVNAGLLSVHLPASSDVSGSLEVNAGSLQVCTPAGVGIRISHEGVADAVTVGGLRQSGRQWQSPDYGSATHRVDLDVVVNFGAVEINPIGGCK
jgi:hypothetical protein